MIQFITDICKKTVQRVFYFFPTIKPAFTNYSLARKNKFWRCRICQVGRVADLKMFIFLSDLLMFLLGHLRVSFQVNVTDAEEMLAIRNIDVSVTDLRFGNGILRGGRIKTKSEKCTSLLKEITDVDKCKLSKCQNGWSHKMRG